ncbi:hypothetical protein TNCV_3493141 [Trichonephila clavipes]|nr:hypothetical protein TNCV_3493141 [Trichonephila clavipes]
MSSSPSPPEDPLCRESHAKFVETHNPPVGLMWKFRDGKPKLMSRPRLLTEARNYEVLQMWLSSSESRFHAIDPRFNSRSGRG